MENYVDFLDDNDKVIRVYGDDFNNICREAKEILGSSKFRHTIAEYKRFTKVFLPKNKPRYTEE